MRIVSPFPSALVLAAAFAAPCFAQHPTVILPVIGEWWQAAGDPDLGPYTTPNQQPVDFGLWQAADGTWQLWSCIRHTAAPGHTRLFYRWEGQKITDRDWTPMGIAMEADPALGEAQGGLQAPHVVKHDGLYYMAYGDWNNICFATSEDGKEFTRVLQPDGRTGVFTEGAAANTRDAMMASINGLWHLYYTGAPHGKGYVYCRMSRDLKDWSPSCVVNYGGAVGMSPWHSECPFVVEVKPGLFYLFRNQYYGENNTNWVYRSDNPLNFGIDDDSGLVAKLDVAAPEIVHHEGRYYIAALRPSLKGIRIAKLDWVETPLAALQILDFDDEAVREQWSIVEGCFPGVFTTSTRSDFGAPMAHFISTTETPDGGYDDDMTGVIESPVFEADREVYDLWVGGGAFPETAYVEVVDADSAERLFHATGEYSNTVRRVMWNAAPHMGRKAKIRIVDRQKGPWGHVVFGGIGRLGDGGREE